MSNNNYYLYKSTEEGFKSQLNTNFVVDKKLEVKNLDEGYILPVSYYTKNSNEWWKLGGVVDKECNFIPESNTNYSRIGFDNSYSFNKDDVDLKLNDVIYCGEWHTHYGHFLVETTVRLWYVVEHYKKGQTKLVFICYKKPRKILKNAKIFFELLGIDINDIIILNKIAFCKNIIIPENSSAITNFVTKEFLIPFRKISDNVESFYKEEQNIYLSRTHLRNIRSSIGENNIEEMFKNNGFKIVYPEEISLKTLISYINNAKMIVGLSGTAPHNVLFASPNTHIVILNRQFSSQTQQELINQILGIKATYIDAYYNFLGDSNSVFLVGLTKPFKRFLLDNKFNYEGVNSVTFKQVKEYLNTFTNNLRNKMELECCHSTGNMMEAWQDVLDSMYIPSKVRITTRLKRFKYFILSKILFGKLKKKYVDRYENYKYKKY